MEGPIDFVVMDTVPGHLRTQKDTTPQSTISRFACRIIVERSPPYTARIYAAGFDSGRNIFLGVIYFLHRQKNFCLHSFKASKFK